MSTDKSMAEFQQNLRRDRIVRMMKINQISLPLEEDNTQQEQVQNLRQQPPVLYKGGKGAGSRGGKVIGTTKSGKPIYDTANHPSHKDFTSEDHRDAQHLHFDEGRYGGKYNEKTGKLEGKDEKRRTQSWNHFVQFHKTKGAETNKTNEHKMLDSVHKTLSKKSSLAYDHDISTNHPLKSESHTTDKQDRDKIKEHLLKNGYKEIKTKDAPNSLFDQDYQHPKTKHIHRVSGNTVLDLHHITDTTDTYHYSRGKVKDSNQQK